MRVLIVHAHPEAASFNGALTARAVETLEAEGHEVRVSDLYELGFDPVSDRRNFASVKNPEVLKQQAEETHAVEVGGFAPDIAAEQEKLLWCDLLIFQIPLWWFGMPAVLKGWVDRVFAMGFAYGGGRWYERGVFRGKRALISLTTGGPATMYSETGLNGSLDTLLYPIQHGIFAFTGFDALEPFVAWGPAHVDDTARRGYLDTYAERLRHIESDEPLRWPSLDDYDLDTFQLRQSTGS